ncbi:FG-GAP-like repeat-containing protein [Rosistilla carotiformis]|uniref:FG-GAP-like repeat-containing protein n=1 Tax=Rosistilla carotiformis TaxID=2528017 RepID=UPI0018D2546B|nr:FG-GAP-like repeat-containing protein [Rosistilla carotiformis]
MISALRQRKLRRRRLQLEQFEPRLQLASDFGGIIGNVFSDQTGDGLSADDLGQESVVLYLYRDGGDGSFDGLLGGDDSFLDSTTTDANGDYAFDRLAAGDYFVERILPAGFIERAGTHVSTLTTISDEQASGESVGVLIDDFSEGDQSLLVDVPGEYDDNSFEAPEASQSILGRERDLYLTLFSGLRVNLDVDSSGGSLNYSSTSDALGEFYVEYDGIDGSSNFDPIGLGGVDLTDGATADSFVLTLGALGALGADSPGAVSIGIFIHTDSVNYSSYSTTIVTPPGGIPFSERVIPFSNFTGIAPGEEADFSNVGGISIRVSSDVPAFDSQTLKIYTVGQVDTRVDFAIYEPLSLGDRVWNDTNNDGNFDLASEIGISDVLLTLYEDNGDGVFSSINDPSIDSTLTDLDGIYSFTNLFPGDYFVQVNDLNFSLGGPLSGYLSSPGNPDPDNDIDNDDNGAEVPGQGVMSLAVTLAANSEPGSISYSDPNANPTLDFGVYAAPDLSITSTDTPDPVVAGNTLTYTLEVHNNGLGDATGVTVVDTLSTNVQIDFVSTSQGTPTWIGNEVTIDLGDLASGGSATISITVIVDPNTANAITSFATVSGNETDIDSANNSASDTTTIEAIIVNSPPIANPDTIFVYEDQPYTGTYSELLLNDTDPDDYDTLTFVAMDGNVVDNGDGTFTYTPPQDKFGDAYEVFYYSIVDDGGLYSVAEVTVNIISVNDPPTVSDLYYSTPNDQALTFVLPLSDFSAGPSNESQALNVVFFDSSSEQGGDVIYNPTDGTVTYYPPSPAQGSQFVGLDSFDFTVADDDGAETTGTIYIYVTANSYLFDDGYSVATGVFPSFVTSGNFDDGFNSTGVSYPDLIVANDFQNSVLGSASLTIVWNPGSSQPAVEPEKSTILLPTNSRPQSVVVGDFDGDSRDDIAVALLGEGRNNGQVYVLLADQVQYGDMPFDESEWILVGTGAGPSAIATADVNNDGNLDLAYTNFYGDTVSILLGTGEGTFQPAQTLAVGTRPSALVFGDIQNDGNVDLAVANYGSDSVSLFLGNGNGNFSDAGTLTGIPTPTGLAVSTLDNNGFDDLAVSGGSQVHIFYNVGNTATPDVASEVIDFDYRLGGIQAADIDRDEDQDLLVANSGGGAVSLLTNLGSGFVHGQTIPVPSIVSQGGALPKNLTVVDLDLDGIQDFAASQVVNGISIHYGRAVSGYGGFGVAMPVVAEFQNAADRFDVNDDGLVSPIDALRILNSLAKQQTAGEAATAAAQANYVDVNGDGQITPIDALMVLNEIQRRKSTTAGEYGLLPLFGDADEEEEQLLETLAIDVERGRKLIP